MRKALIQIFAISGVFCLFAAPCFGEALQAFEGQKGTIKIAGGTAHIPVMKEAAKRIMTRYKDIVITVAGGGSGLGIKQVGEGLVDIGNSGRKPKPEEIEKYKLTMYKWAISDQGPVDRYLFRTNRTLVGSGRREACDYRLYPGRSQRHPCRFLEKSPR